jgi:hypothetical protein
VYINNEQVGKTPYTGEFSAKEVIVKLVPESFDKPLSPFETKVTLEAGIKTIVRRKFGEREEQSAGEVISFEKGDPKNTSIAVVTIPDAAKVNLDSKFIDVSPLKADDITSGNHQIVVSAEGYLERSFIVRAEPGFNMTVIVTLAKDINYSPIQNTTEEPVIESPTYIKILDTPTGFLRVRSQPASSADEVGRVTPGKVYQLEEPDQKDGWYNIQYEEGKQGWISSEYATASAAPEN